jgi:PKD domain
MLAALLLASAAQAAETVIGFDDLAPETLVTNQYEAQGLELGLSKTLGGPAGENGDCGAPTVTEGGVLAPPSPPNYATLGKCLSAGPAFAGSFGKLLKHPSGQVAVEVRNLVSTPNVPIELIAYNSEGHEFAAGHGEASSGAWSKVSVEAGGSPVYFIAIRSEKEVAPVPPIGIDNLSFQIPTNKPPPPTIETPPPTAVGSVLTPDPHPGTPVTLSGGGSSPGSGSIVSYEWDFNNDGKIDTSTGTNPIAHVILTPGSHTIGLTVTNSGGEKSSSKFTLQQTGITLAPPPDGGEGPCLTSLEVVNAELLGECIQKKGKEYVIETKQLSVNGMVLVPRAGGFGVYHLTSTRHLGIGTEYRLSGPPVSIELLNTPIGDMTLGSYNLEAESILLALEVENRPVLKIASARARAADEERVRNLKGNPLMSFGVGKKCDAGTKELGCCPPPGPTHACATLPGNFPLTGQVSVYLTAKGDALFDVEVGLDLKSVNFQATGELELIATRETGIELSTLRFNVPEASLAPIFKVKEASFVYYFPGNPDPARRDSWQAKATITFGLLNEPGLEAELAFQHGQFHSAALALTLPPPGVPLYPGINLNKIGGSVGVEPITFGGSLGARIAAVLELELAFKYAEASEDQLGFFGGKGTLKYEDNEIATLEGDVYSDGYSDALLTLKIGLPFGSKEPVVSAEGEIGYWDESKTGLWEAYGRVHLKLWVIDAEVAGLVNNKYVAGCAFAGPFGALGHWSFETSSIGGEGFIGGNCHDDLKPYRSVPLTQHSGGFVNETETESLRGPLPRPPFAVAASGPGASIALAAAPLGRDLRISSASGTPIVTLLGPNGQSFTTPATPGQALMSGSQFIAALGSDPHQLIVYLSTPSGGEWHLKRAKGSAPIDKVEVAEVVPPPVIHASVRHLGGARYALSYHATNLTSGMKVRFYERGKDSIHGLGTVSASHGRLLFTPTEALARGRRIYATLISGTDVPVQTIAVGSYTAPRAFRPARPGRLRLVRRGKTAVLSWGAVSGARLYKVRVKGSDGRLVTLFAKPSRRSEALANVIAADSFTASVTAVGGVDLLAGRPATVTLKAVLRPRRRR